MRHFLTILSLFLLFSFFPHTSFAQTNSSHEEHQEAIRLAREGKTAEALPLLQQLVKKFPASPDITADYFMTLSWANRFEEAEKVYAAFAKKELFPTYILPELARVYRETEQYEQALDVYQKLGAMESDDREIQKGYLLTLQRKGDSVKAMLEIEKILERTPQSIELWNLLAALYGEKEYWPSFLKAYQKILSLQETSEAIVVSPEVSRYFEKYYDDIIFQARSGDHEEALIRLNELRELGYTKGLFEYDQIAILSWSEDYQKATDLFEALEDREVAPKYVIDSALFSYEALEKYDEMIPLIEKQLQKYPQEPSYLRDLYQAYQFKKDLRKAFAILKELQELSPEDEALRLEEMELVYQMGDWKRYAHLFLESGKYHEQERHRQFFINSLFELLYQQIPISDREEDLRNFDKLEPYLLAVYFISKMDNSQDLDERTMAKLPLLKEQIPHYPPFFQKNLKAAFYLYDQKYQTSDEVLMSGEQKYTEAEAKEKLRETRETLKAEKPVEALEMAQDLIRNMPGMLDALFLKAEILESEKEFLKAIEIYDKILRRYPGNQAAIDLKAKAYMQMQAHSLASVVIQENQDVVNPAIQLEAIGNEAMQYIHWQEYEEAERQLLANLKVTKSLLKEEDTKEGPLGDLILRFISDYGVDEFNRDIENHSLRYMWDLILTYRSSKRMKEVIEVFEEILLLDILPPAWVREAAGDAYLYERQPEKALEVYQTVLDEKPKNHNVQMAIYHTYVELEDYQKAEAILTTLDEATPVKIYERGIYTNNWRKAEILYNKIWLYLYQDRIEKAEDVANEALRAAPFNTNIRTALAHIYLWRGWPRKALEEFRIIHTISPDHLGAKNGFIAAMAQNGKEKEAEAYLEKMREAFPKEKNFQRTERAFELEEKRTFITRGEFTGEDADNEEYIQTVYLDQPLFRDWKVYIEALIRHTEQETDATTLKKIFGGLIYSRDPWLSARVAVQSEREKNKETGYIIGATLRPTDTITIDNTFDSLVTDIPLRSRASNIQAEEFQTSITYRKDENFSISLGGVRRLYTDSNRSNSFYVRTDNAVLTRSHWKTRLGTEFYYTQNDSQGVAYFNPEQIWTYILTPSLEHVWYRKYEKKLVDRIFLSGGFQKQASFSEELIWRVAYELEWTLSDTLNFLVGVGYRLNNYDGEDVKSLNTYFQILKRF